MKLRINPQQHQRALTGSVDIPEERPSFPLSLDAVGISGKTVWVHLPEGRLPFNARFEVDLPAEVRGIHMSRIEEVITELSEVRFTSLSDYAREAGQRMLQRQRGGRGRVHLAGKFPIVRQTIMSDRRSLDTVEIEVDAWFEKEDGDVSAGIMNGVSVSHITACPCTQAYNEVAFPGPRECPMPTHSQRSQTRLMIEIDNSHPSHEEILSCLEGALHVTQDLQKRPDEAEIVMKAHRAPQFAEDAVRETAQAAGLRFGDVLSAGSRIFIESLSLESIHIHDVHCRLETTIDRIGNHLSL